MIQNDRRISRTSNQKPCLAINLVCHEFEAARNIARREDLRDAGQARPHAVTFDVAGDVFHRHEAAIPPVSISSGPQRARGPTKLMSPRKMFQSCGNSVHRGRAHDAADARDARGSCSVACSAPTTASASGIIERNSTRERRVHLHRQRFCPKNTVPPSSSLMMAARTPQSGAVGQHAPGQQDIQRALGDRNALDRNRHRHSRLPTTSTERKRRNSCQRFLEHDAIALDGPCAVVYQSCRSRIAWPGVRDPRRRDTSA